MVRRLENPPKQDLGDNHSDFQPMHGLKLVIKDVVPPNAANLQGDAMREAPSSTSSKRRQRYTNDDKFQQTR